MIILGREIYFINENGELISSDSAQYHIELAELVFDKDPELKSEFEKSGMNPLEFLLGYKGYMAVSAGEKHRNVILDLSLISEKQERWISYFEDKGFELIDLAKDREKPEKGER